MSEASRRAFSKAKRWARRICSEPYRPGKDRAKNRMLESMYSAMSPKPDGTHPLDKFKLEG